VSNSSIQSRPEAFQGLASYYAIWAYAKGIREIPSHPAKTEGVEIGRPLGFMPVGRVLHCALSTGRAFPLRLSFASVNHSPETRSDTPDSARREL